MAGLGSGLCWQITGGRVCDGNQDSKLSIMQYTQPRRWSSMCCNASTFDGEEQKHGRAPTVVDVPPNPRWKASQLAGQQLPAELGDLGRSPKDDCCKHLQGAECATHIDTVDKDGVSFTD